MQNIHSFFHESPEDSVLHHKTQLFMQLITLVRDENAVVDVKSPAFEGWCDKKILDFTKGYVHRISAQEMVEAISRMGYDVYVSLGKKEVKP